MRWRAAAGKPWCRAGAIVYSNLINIVSVCPQAAHRNSRSSHPRLELGMTILRDVIFPHLVQMVSALLDAMIVAMTIQL